MILVGGYQLGGLSPVSLHDVIPRKGRQWLADHHLDEKTNITSQPAKTFKFGDLHFRLGAGPTMVAVAVGSSSWGLVRCIKFAVYGAVCGQIALILIRKYRFVFNRKLL